MFSTLLLKMQRYFKIKIKQEYLLYFLHFLFLNVRKRLQSMFKSVRNVLNGLK